MRYRSAISSSVDPYRAGMEIGQALCTLRPEVVLLFASISYKSDLSALFAGLTETLENPNLIIVGCTGDGVYETTQAANYAVSALGIDSGGTVHFATAVERSVKVDSRGAAERCARKAVRALAAEPNFCMVFADGATADGEEIVQGLRKALDIPVFGGLAGDDRKFTQSRVFLNGEEFEDAVVLLVGHGRLPFAVNTASGWSPLGQAGTVETAEGTTIDTISGRSARDFMTEQLGKPLGEIDVGVISLAAYQAGIDGPYFLRSPNKIDDATGAVSTFGSIASGTLVRICSATREEILQGVALTVKGLLENGLPFEPKAAIVISCAARKWLLADSGVRELAVLFDSLGQQLPVVGFPSFGEVGPFKTPEGYTDSYFHNATFVLCLLGE